ncbi:hypothetical protein [Streptomyces sp. NPDC020298]|uniref:hypothetical protein n=1 Tax=unclassified Streptomyces TaxID=2593676 RepID=UPI0033E1651B
MTGRCTLSGGRWYSWYDNTFIDGPRATAPAAHAAAPAAYTLPLTEAVTAIPVAAPGR